MKKGLPQRHNSILLDEKKIAKLKMKINKDY